MPPLVAAGRHACRRALGALPLVALTGLALLFLPAAEAAHTDAAPRVHDPVTSRPPPWPGPERARTDPATLREALAEVTLHVPPASPPHDPARARPAAVATARDDLVERALTSKRLTPRARRAGAALAAPARATAALESTARAAAAAAASPAPAPRPAAVAPPAPSRPASTAPTSAGRSPAPPPSPTPAPQAARAPAPTAPQPSLAASPTPPAPAGLNEREQRFLAEMNRARVARGLPALSIDGTLVSIARHRSTDMLEAGYFAHISPTGESWYSLAAAAGLRLSAGGENLAKVGGDVERSVQVAIENLLESPTHRANILDARYARVGVGAVTTSNGVTIFTTIFAG